MRFKTATTVEIEQEIELTPEDMLKPNLYVNIARDKAEFNIRCNHRLDDTCRITWTAVKEIEECGDLQ